MSTLLQVIVALAEIVGIIALADLLAGFIHWIEDAYFSDETPVLGPLVIRPNIVHHHLPRYFTKLSWWESSRELVAVGALTLLGAWALHTLTWQVWLFVVISVNANQVHKWSHRTRAENGWLISKLQDWRILQTPRHHGLHHTDPKNTFYCPITNFVNPVLECVAFWQRLENVIERVTGVKHRDDTAVRGNGPGPEWLGEYRTQRASDRAPVAAMQTPRAAAKSVLIFRPECTEFVAAQVALARSDKTCARNCDRCPARCRSQLKAA